MDDFISATQRTSRTADLRMVWWIPAEFWHVSWEQNPNVPQSVQDEMGDVVNRYVVLAVVNGDLGPFGGVRFQPQDETRRSTVLYDSEGNPVAPLDVHDIDADMRVMLDALQPMLASIIGPMGDHMAFFVYPTEDAEGRKVADATTPGTVKVSLAGEEFTYSTPLVPLLEPKVCSECNRSFNGTYRYCPYDRTTLQYSDSDQ